MPTDPIRGQQPVITYESRNVIQGGVEISSLGDNTVYTPTASTKPRIFRVDISPSSDLTGTVVIKIGSTVLFRARNPRSGINYGFNLAPKFTDGAVDDVLVINLPEAVACDANYTLEEIS